MKEWLEFYVIERLWDTWYDLFMHHHRYSSAGMCYYRGEPREHPRSTPFVAWIHKCKCGKEIVDLTDSGIRLLQQGVDYDALIEERL